MSKIAHHDNHGIVLVVRGRFCGKRPENFEGIVQGIEVGNQLFPVRLALREQRYLGRDPAVLLNAPRDIGQGEIGVDSLFCAALRIDPHEFLQVVGLVLSHDRDALGIPWLGQDDVELVAVFRGVLRCQKASVLYVRLGSTGIDNHHPVIVVAIARIQGDSRIEGFRKGRSIHEFHPRGKPGRVLPLEQGTVVGFLDIVSIVVVGAPRLVFFLLELGLEVLYGLFGFVDLLELAAGGRSQFFELAAIGSRTFRTLWAGDEFRFCGKRRESRGILCVPTGKKTAVKRKDRGQEPQHHPIQRGMWKSRPPRDEWTRAILVRSAHR